MKITEAREIKSFLVETDDEEQYQYTRYDYNSWFVRMGESDEPVYDCEELETLFQEYINEKNTSNA